MTPLDDLFSTDESRAEAQLEKVVTLNPADISDFPNHPFKVKQDEAMAEMVDSVKLYGVLAPALVRPKADGGYEMVAGHRRKCAATLAGITEMPCIVRNLTDDEATIIMVDSNLQRETILPSEKAFAYIDSGVIPKFAGCVNGVQWFKDRGQWQDGSFEPSAGQIIFFDWDNKGSSGPQDGQSDHVGIVEKCENGIVYTIEGNSGDSCRQNQYPVGHYEILGYGVPSY